MALWEGITEIFGESLLSNVLVGTAALVIAPIVVPAVAAGLRPVAKTVIRGGVYVYEMTWEIIAEAGEQVGDLMAEARAEMVTSAAGESQA
jgi:hypothetical protein